MHYFHKTANSALVKDNTIPTRMDRCLQPTDVPKIEQLNIRLPEFGADVRRNS